MATIPGNCHIQCKYAWTLAPVKIQKGYPRNQGGRNAAQWFHFPINFDPVWGPDTCPAFNAKYDPKMKKDFDPLTQLAALLG